MRIFIPCLVLILAAIVCNGHTPWLRAYMAAMGVRYQQLQTPNFRIGVYDSGESNLPPLVLVHGFLVDGSLNWFNLVHRLRKHYRIIIPDLLNGNPQKVLDSGYSLDNEALLLRELIDALRLNRPTMVFFSMSCILAPPFASDGRCVLIAPPPLKTKVYIDAMCDLFSNDAAWFSKSLFYDAPLGYTIFSQLMHRRWREHFPDMLKIAAQQSFWAAPLMRHPPDGILLPENDLFFPSSLPCLRDLLPTTDIRLLKQSGHAATWDSAQTIADYLLEIR